MTREPTVAATMTRAVLRFARDRGLDAELLAARVGLFLPLDEDPEARVPFVAHAGLWDQIVRESSDEAIGLALAETAIDADALSVVGHAARTAPTVGDAIRIAVEYAPLLNARAVASLTTTGRGLVVRHAPSALSATARAYTESVIAFYVTCMRQWTGRDDVAPAEVSFAHAAPLDRRAHAALFRCPIRFGATHDGLVVDAETAGLPLVARDPVLHAFLLRRATSLRAALPSSALLLRVEEIVKAELPTGAPTVALVARRLGMSARTLQRRLEDDGAVFGELLDRFRKEHALTLLDDESRTIEDIAIALGFSEPKAFRRAFRRWYGSSPSATRAGRRAARSRIASS